MATALTAKKAQVRDESRHTVDIRASEGGFAALQERRRRIRVLWKPRDKGCLTRCDHMKKLFAILVIGSAAFGAFGEDTNAFLAPLLINGQFYTNARISSVTPAYVVLLFDGGGKKFPLSDLPPHLQKRFNYDPSKAAQFSDQEESRKQLAIERQAEAQDAAIKAQNALGEIQTVTIIKVIGGTPVKCLADTGDGEREIFINGLPAVVAFAFSRCDAGSQAVSAREAQVSTMRRNAERQDANAMTGAEGDPDYVAVIMSQRVQANNAALDAKDASEDLETMKANLAKLSREKEVASHIRAQPTGKIFGATRIWNFVGFASPPAN